jgi:hypothetical protein
VLPWRVAGQLYLLTLVGLIFRIPSKIGSPYTATFAASNIFYIEKRLPIPDLSYTVNLSSHIRISRATPSALRLYFSQFLELNVGLVFDHPDNFQPGTPTSSQ